MRLGIASSPGQFQLLYANMTAVYFHTLKMMTSHEKALLLLVALCSVRTCPFEMQLPVM